MHSKLWTGTKRYRAVRVTVVLFIGNPDTG